MCEYARNRPQLVWQVGNKFRCLLRLLPFTYILKIVYNVTFA